LDADPTDAPYHSSIQRLSFGKILKRVWTLQEETLMFLDMKDENLKTDLAFLLQHLNNLNMILQGKTSSYTNYIQ
jgi:hypothetical protein